MDTYSVKNMARYIKENNISTQDIFVKVKVPGSKSITNRALLLSVLADGVSTLSDVLFSDDSRNFMKCVQKLGFETYIDKDNEIIKVIGNNGIIPKDNAHIYVGSAGTAARFLTALLGISKGIYQLNSSDQMKKRPMKPLLETLEDMGTDITYDGREGFFPFTLKCDGVKKNEITIDINTSSQFLSALLICACCIEDTMIINVTGEHGMSYIDMTIKMMEQFGVHVIKEGSNRFIIEKGQCYRAQDYYIEPDVSTACYFYAMGAILGIKVMVENVHFSSMQGDIQFISFLEQMGCKVEDTKEGIILQGPLDGKLKGITANMHSCSDQAITMAAISVYADSPVSITGIGHIQYQECNRMDAIVTELGRMGIESERTNDSIIIYPGQIRPTKISTYEDHRMAMGFSLSGLRSDGIVISNPLCCKKTFENYFDVLDDVIRKIEK